MNSFNFAKWNSILGWFAFGIALLTYTLTLEPTVSYWDCGEYIATSVKLEVGHPPGAPLFQMLGAFFAMFTNEVTQIAKMVNFMSALASAFTILFMFWTISIMAQKLVKKTGEITKDAAFAILGSALVGSLAYTFTDSFWFSAVEGEVYAMSSFLMALLFWLALRWEQVMDNPQGNKWLLLISFVVGLSFGVHILSLLVIPAIVFIYVYKKYGDLNTKQFVIANVVSALVLAFVFKFLFPFTLKYFSALELLFVNSFGLPFNSGSIFAAILLLILFPVGLKYTRKNNLVGANTLILSILFIILGFSSWIMLPIRANANTTINENNPSSARELLAYYNREQYGDANVFYDTYYSLIYNREVDENNPTVDDKPKYEKDFKTGTYIIVNDYKNASPNWNSNHKGFIPRMVSTDANVIKNYKSIAGIPQASKRRPTFVENIRFMINYQFGYMYGRYFMWNFVGRQNDEQGNLDNVDGNWLSGISFIDELFIGSQTNLPADVKNNKGRNTYYFLPLILGVLGLYYQYKKDKNDFYTLFLFFAFTGLAIIFYTNPKPFEPRERDYAVVGSFYIFSIWIGFGVLALFDLLKKYINPTSVALGVTLFSLLAVPTLMASQNWDDHDRSNRYTSHLNAKAYLDSCDPNAILFTIGDNDTFPLWYMQEVENYRTDMKLINTSLFQTDWYIDQMKRKTYDADPIPSQLTHEKYKLGTLDVVYFFQEIQDMNFPQFKDSIVDIDFFMKWIESDNPITFYDLDDDGRKEKVIPTNKIRLKVDKEAVLKNGIVAKKDAHLIVPYIDITIDNAVTKNRILMLDILANFKWEKPIYFTGGAQADEEYIWLKDYLQLEGMTYKFVPILTPDDGNFFEMGRINTDIMYKNVKKWDWRNITDDGIYLDPETRKNSVSYRNNMERLAVALISENKLKKAEEILDLSIEKMPVHKFGHYSMLISYIELYYTLNKTEKARKLSVELKKIFQDQLLYYSQFDTTQLENSFKDFERNFLMYDQIIKTTENYDTKAYSNKEKQEYVSYLKMFEHFIQQE
ncbi:DUF2723 domain-containing protein [Lutibacter sp.]|uniref:glycosyltransferase family 117 protein n=1 Tax=Lutibacter sp. TaxID=1925666 RepID=UPI00273705CB|nr:DUF2723 domain-containing protein [Lutibacter sp.]MDP3312784.1 DUF2723 domain-containing protein [Lutibacter sp.]